MPRARRRHHPCRSAARRGPVPGRPQQRRRPPSAEPAPAGRREALLVLSFGGPEGHDDVHAVPGERHPRPRHPARAAGGGRRALPPLRRRQPDQRAEQGADRRGRDGPRRGRHRPARLLGQPQLGALRRGHLAADGRRRHRARLRLRDVGLRVVLRLPAVPRGHRPGPRRDDRDAGRARPRRSCRTTSTPRASCGPTPTRWPRPSPAARRRPRTAPGWSPRRTASRTRWPPSPARRGTPTRPSCRRPRGRSSTEVAPGRPFDLVWQSRSGPPSVPWLEPDVNDHLRGAGRGRARRPSSSSRSGSSATTSR